MHIAILDKEEISTIGGMCVFTERFAEYARRAGHRVSIIRFAKQTLPKNHHRLPYTIAVLDKFIIPTMKALPIIRETLSDVCPDILYQYPGISTIDLSVAALSHTLKIPVAGVFHQDLTTSNAIMNMTMKSVFRFVGSYVKHLDLVHVFSPALSAFYGSIGIDSSRILVLPNGVNADFYSPGTSLFAQKHEIDIGILFLGRLMFEKNPELLIKAFLSIQPPLGTKLVIVGNGLLEKPLRNKYHDPRIIFTGLIENEEEKRDIIRSCRIFVQPSLTEGMSLALLESMSTGLVPVSSDVGANGVAIADTGFLIPPQHLPRELPKILTQLLAHPEEITDRGARARTQILTHHRQEIIFDTLLAAFAETVAKYHERVSR